jgi:deoxyhypusine synthase
MGPMGADTTFEQQLAWRLSDRPILETEREEFRIPEYRQNAKCTIFLSYTSNIISSGLRETIRFLVQNKLVCATPCFCVSCW